MPGDVTATSLYAYVDRHRLVVVPKPRNAGFGREVGQLFFKTTVLTQRLDVDSWSPQEVVSEELSSLAEPQLAVGTTVVLDAGGTTLEGAVGLLQDIPVTVPEPPGVELPGGGGTLPSGRFRVELCGFYAATETFDAPNPFYPGDEVKTFVHAAHVSLTEPREEQYLLTKRGTEIHVGTGQFVGQGLVAWEGSLTSGTDGVVVCPILFEQDTLNADDLILPDWRKELPPRAVTRVLGMHTRLTGAGIAALSRELLEDPDAIRLTDVLGKIAADTEALDALVPALSDLAITWTRSSGHRPIGSTAGRGDRRSMAPLALVLTYELASLLDPAGRTGALQPLVSALFEQAGLDGDLIPVPLGAIPLVFRDTAPGDGPGCYVAFLRVTTAPVSTGVFFAPGLDVSPEGDDVAYGGGEFTLLRNHSDESVDVSGWQILDGQQHTLTIPDGRVLAPGGALRVFTGPGEDGEDAVFMGLGRAILNNEGHDSLTLTDASGNLVDWVAYSAAGIMGR